MSLFDRLFDGFQFLAQIGPKVDALQAQLGGLDGDIRDLQMRVVRLETIVEIMRGERLPALPLLAGPADSSDKP